MGISCAFIVEIIRKKAIVEKLVDNSILIVTMMALCFFCGIATVSAWQYKKFAQQHGSMVEERLAAMVKAASDTLAQEKDKLASTLEQISKVHNEQVNQFALLADRVDGMQASKIGQGSARARFPG